MKTAIKKIVTVIILLLILVSQHVIYASMADFTDEQADKATKQNQEEWKKEQGERINKSSNNYLKSLSVEGFKITPIFDKQTIEYEIESEISSDYIEIKAETDDEKASVSGIGKISLNSGNNNIRIDVTAENGTVRTYFIKVVKKVSKKITLESLKLATNDGREIEYTPEFNEKTYEYNCTIENYVETINIEAISSKKDLNVEVSGNKNLKDGFNEILITISEKNEEKVVYKINAYKKEQNNIQEIKNTIDYKIIITIVIIAIAALIIIIIIKKKHRTVGRHG